MVSIVTLILRTLARLGRGYVKDSPNLDC